MSEIQAKIEKLQQRHAELTRQKAGVAGQVAAKKEELAALVREIREAGYDPKTLPAERDRVKAELEAAIVKLDADLTEVEKALASLPTNA